MEKPIISTWGIGPSYRKRVKLNILDAMNSGYENTMDYIVLTDCPEDFEEFAKQTGKIKAIIDIHEEREKYPWSKELEYIPQSKNDEKDYGKEYLNNLSQDKLFSYSLHRFSFPTLAKLGYTKVVFMDSDVKIKYEKIGKDMTEEEFWEEFNTPQNSMKGFVAETVQIDPANNFTLRLARAMGSFQSMMSLQICSIVLYQMFKDKNINRPFLVDKFSICEGPFRYYHFSSPEKLQECFEAWNEAIRIIFSNHFMRHYQQCGGYMLCDYMPVAIANIFSDIQVLNFPNRVYNVHIHFEDRYFLPIGQGAPGLGIQFSPAETQEEFMERNKEVKKILDDRNAWPHQEPNYF